MNIENYFKKPFKLILIILGAIIFSLLFIYFSAFLIMFVLADFDMNKYHVGRMC